MQLATVAVNGVAPHRIRKKVSQMRMETIRFSCDLYSSHCRTRLVLRLVWAKHVGPWRPSCPLSLVLKAPGDPDASCTVRKRASVYMRLQKALEKSANFGAPPPERSSLFTVYVVEAGYSSGALVNHSCIGASQTFSCSRQVSRRQYRPVFTWVPHQLIAQTRWPTWTGWGLCITATISLSNDQKVKQLVENVF